MLLFRDYARTNERFQQQAKQQQVKFEPVIVDGLLKDGWEALGLYFQCKMPCVTSGREALQMILFFDRMACDHFVVKEQFLEKIYADKRSVLDAPDVAHNLHLTQTFENLLCDKLEKQEGEEAKRRKLKDDSENVSTVEAMRKTTIEGLQRDDQERQDREAAAIQEFLRHGPQSLPQAPAHS